jgi:hypothetical protein
MRQILLFLLLAAVLLTLPPTYKAEAHRFAVSMEAYNSNERTQTKQSDIAEIEIYTSGLDRYIKRNERAARYFADTASYEQENAPARWQEFKTKRMLDKAWQDSKTYTSSFSSPSGDWVQYVTDYYRKDGTLAKSNAELRTFMGDIIRINDRLYADNGKLLKEQTRYLDLKTRKPKRVKKDEFMDMEAPLYPKASALPFYSLLKKR